MKLVAVICGLLVLLALAGPALADGPLPYPTKVHKPDYYGYGDEKRAKPDYHYAYGIKDKYSGVNVDVKENRKGDWTEGAYASALPDGRTQVVKYWVKKGSGFNADVKYFGVAKHPVPIKKVAKPVKFFPHKPFKHVAHIPKPDFKPVDSYASYEPSFPHGKKFDGFKHDQGFPTQLFFQKPAFKPHFDGKYDDDGKHHF